MTITIDLWTLGGFIVGLLILLVIWKRKFFANVIGGLIDWSMDEGAPLLFIGFIFGMIIFIGVTVSRANRWPGKWETLRQDISKTRPYELRCVQDFVKNVAPTAEKLNKDQFLSIVESFPADEKRQVRDLIAPFVNDSYISDPNMSLYAKEKS